MDCIIENRSAQTEENDIEIDYCDITISLTSNYSGDIQIYNFAYYDKETKTITLSGSDTFYDSSPGRTRTANLSGSIRLK